LVHGQNPGVADRRAEHIAREVVQDGVVAVAVMFYEGDPLESPDSGRDACEQFRLVLLEGIAELGGDLSGEQRNRQEKRPPSSFVQQAAMSARALFCEGIIRWPYCDVYLGPKRRTTSASSTPVFVE